MNDTPLCAIFSNREECSVLGKHIIYSQKTIERLMAEGRGQGEGAEYKPWIQVDDFPSSGRSHRIQDIYTGRIHHFFSDLEMLYYYILRWNDNITDIREQYPLLTSITFEKSRELGIRHPVNRDQSLYVMTTDFLISHRNPLTGEIDLCARSVKPQKKVSSPRTSEKLQLEQLYWAELNIPWKCITEQSFSRNKAKNIRKILSFYNDTLNSTNLSLKQDLLENLLNTPQIKLSTICSRLDSKYSLTSGDTLRLFFHFVSQKAFAIDIEGSILPTQPVEEFIDLCSVSSFLNNEMEVNTSNELIS